MEQQEKTEQALSAKKIKEMKKAEKRKQKEAKKSGRRVMGLTYQYALICSSAVRYIPASMTGRQIESTTNSFRLLLKKGITKGKQK